MAYTARLIAELIGDAFIEAIERSRHRSLDQARAAWRWILESAEAPPGIELVAPDGSAYTGLVFVERNRAVLLLALRHPTHTARVRAERTDWEPRVRHPSLFHEDDSVQDERHPRYRR